MTASAEAQARARAARARLGETLAQVQERLRPSHLAQDAVEGAAQGVASAARRGAEAVRSRPFALAAFTGAIGLVMARGWIADIVRGKSAGADETAKPSGGLEPKPKKRAPRARKETK